MNVLYLTNLPAPYRVDFFNELGKEVNLTVLYERQTAGDRDARWRSRNAENFRELYLGGVKISAAASFSRNVLHYLKDNSFDVRISGGYSTPTEMLAIRYMKRHNMRYILSIDGGFPAKEHPLLKKIKTYFISGAALYLGTGKNAAGYFTHYGADRNKILQYHFTSLFKNDMLAAPPTEPEKIKLRKELGICAKKMVLSVGRLLPLKRYDLLIEAAKDFPDTEVVIVGGTADRYHMELIDRMGAKNVRFIDFLLYSGLVRYFRAADVFVMPSDSDVWGMVLVEAMANGLPVIATDSCGAAPDLILEGENGMIVPKGNMMKIREGLAFLLSSDHTRYCFGKKSLSVIKEYTIENEVRDHIQAIDTFMGR